MANLTALRASETLADLFRYANDESGSALGGGLLIGLWVVLVVRYARHDVDNAVLGASFICFLIAAMLRLAGFANLLLPLAFLALTALSGLYKVFSSKS